MPGPRTTVAAAGAALAVAGAVIAASPSTATTGRGPAATAPAGASTTAAAAVAAPRAAAATVRWGTCKDARLVRAKANCGMLAVPLDHSRPDGPKIQLALSRIKHTTAKSQGIMIVNPGGPGGSGLALSLLGAAIPKGAGRSYDWIGFDPRGVGSSKPALRCNRQYFKGPRPLPEPSTPQAETANLDRARAYAQACGRAGGALLAHMRTTDSARDLDRIRIALGQKQINYYGFSYGTYLGQVYATLFPTRVRRMVLDADVDPTRVFYASNLDQDRAFERVLKVFFTWTAKYDRVYHLGRTAKAVEQRFYTERKALTKKPAGGVVGAAEWTDVFVPAGYTPAAWPGLARVWSTWNKTHRDARPLVTAYTNASGLGDDNNYAVYNAVQCTDAPWPSSFDQWRTDNTAVAATARFLTWNNAWYNAPCLFWPAASRAAFTVDGRRAPAILLVNETLDAATPYPGALTVRRLFPRSRLVAVPGGTAHAGSLRGNACEGAVIAAYLAGGTLPKRLSGRRADVTCKALPQPVPAR